MVVAVTLVALPELANAQAGDKILSGLTDAAGDNYDTGADIYVIIGNIVSALLGVMGVLFMVLLVYAGFLYLTAAGETGKVDKAKKLISQSIIGLVIIVGAYALSTFVIGLLTEATAETTSATSYITPYIS